MMSSWKGLIGREMTSSSNMRILRDDVIMEGVNREGDDVIVKHENTAG
jgi:hypothetical protein